MYSLSLEGAPWNAQVSFFASSLFCVGRLNRGCYLHINSVTEPPPGRPLGAAACIAGGDVGAVSPHKMYPVHSSYPYQITKSPFLRSVHKGGFFQIGIIVNRSVQGLHSTTESPIIGSVISFSVFLSIYHTPKKPMTTPPKRSRIRSIIVSSSPC